MTNVLYLCESPGTGGTKNAKANRLKALDKNGYRSMVQLLSAGRLKATLENPTIQSGRGSALANACRVLVDRYVTVISRRQ